MGSGAGMELRRLGATGLAVSPVGLGTVKFGRDRGVRYPTAFRLPDDAAIRALLAAAREEGVNLLDTAPAYGLAEERLGRLLDDRDRWVLVGKAGERFADGRSSFDFSAAGLEASVEASLARLRTDRLDVLLLHAGDDDVDLVARDEPFEALARLKAAGKARAVGISSKSVAAGLAAVARVDVLMLAWNEADHSQLPVMQAAAAAGRGVLVKKPLDSGHAAAGGAGAIAAAWRSALAQPAVAAAVAGTLSVDHLRQNCAAARAAVAGAASR